MKQQDVVMICLMLIIFKNLYMIFHTLVNSIVSFYFNSTCTVSLYNSELKNGKL